MSIILYWTTFLKFDKFCFSSPVDRVTVCGLIWAVLDSWWCRRPALYVSDVCRHNLIACLIIPVMSGMGGRTPQGTGAGRPWDRTSAWLNTDSDKGCQPTGQADGLLAGRCGLDAAWTGHVAAHKSGAHDTVADGAQVCNVCVQLVWLCCMLLSYS